MSAVSYPSVLKRGHLFVRSRLLDAGDHLLYVDGVFQEKVRRFYYRDIQAVLWSRNSFAMIWRVILMILMALPGIGFLFSPEPIISSFFLLPSMAIFARVLWVKNHGGYCICCVVTAAQGQQIVAAHTVPRTRALTEHIRRHPDVAVL